MRCFNKMISIIIIIIGILISNSYAVSYADASDISNNTSSVELLVMLGVIENNIDVEKNITRAEFASMMFGILGKTPLSLIKPFSDVPSGHKMAKEIETVSSMGIMNGYDDNTFRPDDTILIQDVIKTLICVAGYNVKAEVKGGYPFGYLQTAREDGMLSGLSINISSEALLWQVAKLTENMLNMPQLEIDTLGSDISYKKSSEHTLMYRYFQAEKGKGIITANSLTSLSKSIYSKKGRVEIEGVIYSAGKTAAEDMLGQNVEFYYDASDTDEPEIIYIRQYKNEFLKIEAADIIGFNDDKYTYADGDYISKADLNQNYRIIYNKIALEEFALKKMIPTCGNVLLIDNNRDGEYDVVFVFDYDNIVVGSIDADNEKVYDKRDSSKFIELDGVNKTQSKILKDIKGNIIDISALTKSDVISFLRNDDFFELIVVKDKASGVIEEIVGMDNELEYVINGLSYKLSDTFSVSADGRQVSVGDSGIFLINIMKEIEYFEYSGTSGKIAYVINTSLDTKGVDKSVLLKLFTEEGKIDIFKTASGKLRLDDRVVDSNAELLAGITVGTLIMYDLNSDGKISRLYTPHESSSLNAAFYKTFSSGTDLLYKSRAKVFDGKAAIASESVVFLVPPAMFEDREEYYQIGDASSLIDGLSYNIEAYNIDINRLTAKYILIKGQVSAEKISESTGFSVVNKITEVLNKEGIPSYKLELYSEGSIVSKILESNDLINQGKTPQGKPVTISEGDIVRFAVDFNGIINDIQITYDVETETFYDRTSSGTYDAKIKTAIGYVIDTENTTFKLASDLSGNNPMLYSTDGAIVYVYDSNILRSDKVRVGKYTDILSYNQVGDSCSKVFVYLRGGVPKTVVIYK